MLLKNACLDAKIGFDPAEYEPRKECCAVAHASPIDGLAEGLHRDFRHLRVLRVAEGDRGRDVRT